MKKRSILCAALVAAVSVATVTEALAADTNSEAINAFVKSSTENRIISAVNTAVSKSATAAEAVQESGIYYDGEPVYNAAEQFFSGILYCSVKNVKMMKNKLKLSTNKSFSIQNCRHLKLIEVGEGSFIDFGRFEITNCQKLEALSIGSEKDSWNFFAASFIIQSMKEREEGCVTNRFGKSENHLFGRLCVQNVHRNLHREYRSVCVSI